MMKCVSRTSGGIIKGHRRNPPEKVPNPPWKNSKPPRSSGSFLRVSQSIKIADFLMLRYLHLGNYVECT